jgi:hypothetical protein
MTSPSLESMAQVMTKLKRCCDVAHNGAHAITNSDGSGACCHQKAPAKAGAVSYLSDVAVIQKLLMRGLSICKVLRGPAATNGSIPLSIGEDVPEASPVTVAGSATGALAGVITIELFR